MVSLNENECLTLIDFEYAFWNPLAYDMANYLNECATDNSYPGKGAHRLYMSNFPTKTEIQTLIRCYLACYHKVKKIEVPFDQFFESRIEQLEKEVHKCMILNNFYWAVWAYMILKDKEICKEETFNYFFSAHRAQLQKHCKKEFGL